MPKAYVYQIEVDGIVRYVGKGTGDRVQRHIGKAKRINVMREGGAKVRTTPFHNKLAKALREERLITSTIVASDMADDAAFAMEIELIAQFPVEQLWNLRSGGEGFTSADMHRLWSDPEFRNKVSAAIRTGQQTTVCKALMSTASKKRWEDAAYRKRRSIETVALWKDPQWRRRQVDARIGGSQTEESKRKRSEALKKKWQDPEFRARKTASIRATNSSLAYRAAMSAAMKTLLADPDLSAQQAARFGNR